MKHYAVNVWHFNGKPFLVGMGHDTAEAAEQSGKESATKYGDQNTFTTVEATDYNSANRLIKQ
jgi:hypothetical protein